MTWAETSSEAGGRGLQSWSQASGKVRLDQQRPPMSGYGDRAYSVG